MLLTPTVLSSRGLLFIYNVAEPLFNGMYYTQLEGIFIVTWFLSSGVPHRLRGDVPCGGLRGGGQDL